MWQGLWNQRSTCVGRHVKVRSSAEVLLALELGRLFPLAHQAAGGRAGGPKAEMRCSMVKQVSRLGTNYFALD